MDELMVEDRVNDEVREILKKYTGEIEKGRLDYRRMFELTKKKIVEETRETEVMTKVNLDSEGKADLATVPEIGVDSGRGRFNSNTHVL
jgi:hypothetical protein